LGPQITGFGEIVVDKIQVQEDLVSMAHVIFEKQGDREKEMTITEELKI
jgi:hypothetical protein